MVFSRPVLQQPAAGAASKQLVVSSQDSAHPGASRLALFRAVSDDTLGNFWSLFLGPSVLRPGPTFLQQPAAGAASSQQQPAASSQEVGSRQPVVSSQDSASGGWPCTTPAAGAASSSQ